MTTHCRTLSDVGDHRATVSTLRRVVQAQQLINDMNAQIQTARAQAQASGVTKFSVCLIVGRTPNGLADVFAAGPGSPLDELLRECGIPNAVAVGKPWQSLSREDIIRLNPDVILDIQNGAPPAQVPLLERHWQALTAVTAVREGRVKVLTDSAYIIMGPRLGLAALGLVNELAALTNH